MQVVETDDDRLLIADGTVDMRKVLMDAKEEGVVIDDVDDTLKDVRDSVSDHYVLIRQSGWIVD